MREGVGKSVEKCKKSVCVLKRDVSRRVSGIAENRVGGEDRKMQTKSPWGMANTVYEKPRSTLLRGFIPFCRVDYPKVVGVCDMPNSNFFDFFPLLLACRYRS